MNVRRFPVGPFTYEVGCELAPAREAVEFLYADYPQLAADAWVDFRVRVAADGRFAWLRRNPKYKILLDAFVPFPPFRREQTAAMMEWGMNWCIWLNVSHLIIFHAAMLASGANGLIMAADSGDGKSTLAAGLALSGWRLLSDELTLLDPEDTELVEPRAGETDGAATAFTGEVGRQGGRYEVAKMVPLTRPICVKNESIRVIRELFPDALMTRPCADTVKGEVAHIRPPTDAVRLARQRVLPRWVVFPKYVPGKKAVWTPWEKAEAFIQLGQHGRAYSVLGGRGFETLAGVISHCDCWRFEYGSLEDAIREFQRLETGALPC